MVGKISDEELAGVDISGLDIGFIGSVTSDPAKGDSLEEYVRQADEKMYKEKVEKKANRK